MFEAIGYEVSYRPGFVKSAFGNRYSEKADTYIERQALYTAIRRARSTVLGLCKDAAVTLTDIDTDSGGYNATGFRIMVIVRKDENLVENLNQALRCFETSLDWEEYQDGPYVTLNRDFRTVEWEVDPPRPHLAD